MGKRKYTICFVDDQKDELQRFRHNLGEFFVIGAGRTVDEALDDLEQHQHIKKPDLFVLDMYFPIEQDSSGRAERDLHSARRRFLVALKEYRDTLARFDQTADGGFRNLDSVRTRYKPLHKPVVFFTRKGTLDDAIKAYDESVPLVKKPDPDLSAATLARDEEDLKGLYDAAFREKATYVASEFRRIIRAASWWVRYREQIQGAAIAFAVEVAVILIVGALGALLKLFEHQR